jgi:hypothetical protein
MILEVLASFCALLLAQIRQMRIADLVAVLTDGFGVKSLAMTHYMENGRHS